MDRQIETLITHLRTYECVECEQTNINKIKPWVQQAIDNCNDIDKKYYQIDEEQGWCLHTLYCCDKRALCAFIVSWLPGRGTPPHDHGTWAVIGGLRGVEKNIFWEKVKEDGEQIEIKEGQVLHCAPGEVISMGREAIHSVFNESSDITLSLHVYGCHPNDAARCYYDPDQALSFPFKTKAVD